jgi:hypothetical protein
MPLRKPPAPPKPSCLHRWDLEPYKASAWGHCALCGVSRLHSGAPSAFLLRNNIRTTTAAHP